MSKSQKSSTEPEHTQALLSPDLGVMRASRIHDYLKAALAQADPLLANLGAVHSDLLQMQHKLKQAIDNAMTDTAGELSDLDVLLRALDHLLRLTKQIDRFTQLELRLKKPGSPSSAVEHSSASVHGRQLSSLGGPPASEESNF